MLPYMAYMDSMGDVFHDVSFIELDDGKIGTGKPYIWW